MEEDIRILPREEAVVGLAVEEEAAEAVQTCSSGIHHRPDCQLLLSRKLQQRTVAD